MVELEGVRYALPRYVEVVKGRRSAKVLIDKAYPVTFDPDASIDEMWRIHKKMLRSYKFFQSSFDSGSKPSPVEASFLDLKVELAHKMMQDCHFCERRCGVNRLSGGKGYCRCGRDFVVSSAFPHIGEEPELIPSGTVFTSGCSIRCLHCQNYDISQWLSPGTPMKPEIMAGLVKRLIDKGCVNLNMVGGDPTPNTWLWLDTMRYLRENFATIWNSNSWYSYETSELLAGFVDVYLLDFKYGNNDCALTISEAPDYWVTCKRNHLKAKEHGELIVRVLVLPGHNECCTHPILEWIARNLGVNTRVNLMFQYHPEWRASERPELSRKLTIREMEEALRLAREAGLRNRV